MVDDERGSRFATPFLFFLPTADDVPPAMNGLP